MSQHQITDHLSWKLLFGISLAVSTLVLGVRQLGVLERMELTTFDQFVRWQPDPGTDPRLLIVAVTEEDIQNPGKSDSVINQVLMKLEQYQPRVIGLDIYRDLPVEPGHIDLITTLQVSNNIIAVCKSGDASSTGVGPPSTVPEARLGFSDIVIDLDGIVRRNLMALTPNPNSKCLASSSFGLQLALQYFEKEGIQWQKTPQEELQIGSVRFQPLTENTGGYQTVDSRGYQILLNYRSRNIAQQVSLRQLLQGQIDPSWVKDRIVMIGVTAPSGNDFFFTPYSAGEQSFRMAGVEVHAQMVSQFLSAVLDRRPLLWIWADLGEFVWIWLWTVLGTLLAGALRRPLLLFVTGAATLAILVGISYILFTQGGWVPLVPSALAFTGAIIIMISYRAYKPAEVVQLPLQPDEAETEPDEAETEMPPENEPSVEIYLLLQGRYKIKKEIGEGGFGKTYLAVDNLRPGSPVCVVKQLNPSCNDQEYLQIARDLFNREAITLEQLGRHDQIPRLLAYFEQEQKFYLVQDFISGETLEEILSPKDCPPQRLLEHQVLDMLKDILPVLEFVHNHEVIHRDIKPANLIQRKPDGRMVLIDFGAVKLLQTQLIDPQSNPSTIAIGTRGYMPSEQFEGHPVFNSDIYALGIVCIRGLTGKVPSQLTRDETTREILWRNCASVSNKLASVLDKMIRYDFRERYESVTEVLQDVLEV